jgi:hypothetical protein
MPTVSHRGPPVLRLTRSVSRVWSVPLTRRGSGWLGPAIDTATASRSSSAIAASSGHGSTRTASSTASWIRWSGSRCRLDGAGVLEEGASRSGGHTAMVLSVGRPHIDRSAGHPSSGRMICNDELPRARLSPEQSETRIRARHQHTVVEAGDAVEPVERLTGAQFADDVRAESHYRPVAEGVVPSPLEGRDA